MARIETFFAEAEINLTASVGDMGVNLENDVIVVQALMKYALPDIRFFKGMKFPEPNGTMDKDTKSLIKNYQRYLRRIVGINVSVDGRIDPAKGTTAYGKNGQWTIQLLNAAALEMYCLNGRKGASYLHDICRRFPLVRNAVGELPVGTLGLTLEPSAARGIGSLGLSLE